MTRERWGAWRALGIVGIAATILTAGAWLAFAPGAAAAPDTQCVACHTDPARLQALTPPDPPAEEEGEG